MIDPATGGAIGIGLGVGKQVTKDVFSPALKELGEPLRLMAARLVAPLTDRLRKPEEVTDQFMAKVLDELGARGVSPGQLRAPAEETLTQVVFCNLLAGAQPDLHEMFANLLATEMDSSMTRVHPAYAEVIRQLSSSEARMLKCLALREPTDPVVVEALIDESTGNATEYYHPRGDLGVFPMGCQETQFMPVAENLMRLQLATFTTYAGARKPGSAIPEMLRVLALTRFGRDLCNACIRQEGAA